MKRLGLRSENKAYTDLLRYYSNEIISKGRLDVLTFESAYCSIESFRNAYPFEDITRSKKAFLESGSYFIYKGRFGLVELQDSGDAKVNDGCVRVSSSLETYRLDEVHIVPKVCVDAALVSLSNYVSLKKSFTTIRLLSGTELKVRVIDSIISETGEVKAKLCDGALVTFSIINIDNVQ